MEAKDETPTELNLRAARALVSHKQEILRSLSDLENTDPENEALREVEDLGGIGIFGMTLNRVADVSQGNIEKITPSNAEFVVAYLNSSPIQHFIVEQSGGDLTLNDVSEIRDFFLSQA